MSLKVFCHVDICAKEPFFYVVTEAECNPMTFGSSHQISGTSYDYYTIILLHYHITIHAQ